MESSSLATREGIVSEDDSDSEQKSKAYRDVVSAVALESMGSLTLNADIFGNRITEIQELMRVQNNLHEAAETARQEERRRRRNSWIGWGKWIVLGLLALVLDNVLGAISLGVATYWHNKK
ncbi:hypothetical protein BTUL_0025g00480 [Botrytis tulipae]|uniref:Uncharacterized protein n=1 Tax=Botrytis tulipae TaxID=87230 RepID=A0A4Z1F1U2_9HELO|nr:hypothetical protein BTUL_0025g00480 [Botrytis tulipae]